MTDDPALVRGATATTSTRSSVIFKSFEINPRNPHIHNLLVSLPHTPSLAYRRHSLAFLVYLTRGASVAVRSLRLRHPWLRLHSLPPALRCGGEWCCRAGALTEGAVDRAARGAPGAALVVHGARSGRSRRVQRGGRPSPRPARDSPARNGKVD